MSEQIPYISTNDGFSSNRRIRASSSPALYISLPHGLDSEQNSTDSLPASDRTIAETALYNSWMPRTRGADYNRLQQQHQRQQNQGNWFNGSDEPLMYSQHVCSLLAMLNGLNMNTGASFHPYLHDQSRSSSPPPYTVHDDSSNQFSSRAAFEPPPPSIRRNQYSCRILPPMPQHGDVGVSNVLPSFHKSRPPSPEQVVDEERNPSRGIWHKTMAFFKYITTIDSSIPSPPPSELGSTRRNSFDGQSRPESLAAESSERLVEYDHDMFIRAMKLTLECDDGDNTGGSEPIDVDLQAFGDPNVAPEAEEAQKLIRRYRDNRKKLTFRERSREPNHENIHFKDSMSYFSPSLLPC